VPVCPGLPRRPHAPCDPTRRGARTPRNPTRARPIVLAGPSQISTAARWRSRARHAQGLGAEAWVAGASPPIPCPHAPPTRPPLPWQAFPTRSPPQHSDKNAFHRLASCGTPRFGALERACGQRRGSESSRPLSGCNYGVLFSVRRRHQNYIRQWGHVLQDHYSNHRLRVQRKLLPSVPKVLIVVPLRRLLQQVHVLLVQQRRMGDGGHSELRT
jgi:hypothetical protein